MLAHLTEQDNYEFFHHYILIDNCSRREKCLNIRVPGGTVGGVWIDDNNVITKIKIDTNYVVESYQSNVNEVIQKFVGEEIEW